MKYLFLVLFVFSAGIMFSQDYKISTDDKKNEPMLVGTVSKTQLTEGTFAEWFVKSYDIHKLDLRTLEKSDKDFSNLNITVVLGTWCGDSREFVPPFLKILDTLGFPGQNLKLICVDRQKNGMGDEVKDLDVKLVPTIIFYKDGNEIGRIIESPKQGLEKDFLKITTGKE